MLCLFDIDGTLVDTGGAGMKALQEANIEVFGHEGPPLDLAGATDLGIINGLLSHFGIEPTRDRIDAYFEVYISRLDWNLAHGGFPGKVFSGVVEILTALSGDQRIATGLLTGNTAAGAASKMRHFGLHGYFPFGAYGCDHADRNLLGPVALQRAAAHASRDFSPAETWIIGDTPKDIACAKAIGARCLAVATGRFSVAELEMAGADVTLDSLNGALPYLLRA